MANVCFSNIAENSSVGDVVGVCVLALAKNLIFSIASSGLEMKNESSLS